jgi:hypothetical protein
MLSLTNVEKNALGQSGELMSTDVQQTQRQTQDQVVDSLLNFKHNDNMKEKMREIAENRVISDKTKEKIKLSKTVQS